MNNKFLLAYRKYFSDRFKRPEKSHIFNKGWLPAITLKSLIACQKFRKFRSMTSQDKINIRIKEDAITDTFNFLLINSLLRTGAWYEMPLKLGYLGIIKIFVPDTSKNVDVTFSIKDGQPIESIPNRYFNKTRYIAALRWTPSRKQGIKNKYYMEFKSGTVPKSIISKRMIQTHNTDLFVSPIVATKARSGRSRKQTLVVDKSKPKSKISNVDINKLKYKK